MFEFCFELVADGKFFNKRMHALFGNTLIFARKAFKRLIWFFETLSAQDGLNGLRDNSPVILEVLCKSLLIEQQLLETFERGAKCNYAVCKRHANYT